MKNENFIRNVLSEMERFRKKHEDKTESSDYIIRVCEAIFAQHCGFQGRTEWLDFLKNSTPSAQKKEMEETCENKDMEYGKRTEVTIEHVKYKVLPFSEGIAFIDVRALQYGRREFPCSNGRTYTLTKHQAVDVLRFVVEQRKKARMQDKVKTIDGWHISGAEDFREYCFPGDEVSEEVVDYFLDILPPKSLSYGYLQVGEPYSYEEDECGKHRSTYSTFKKDGDKWMYVGECFVGECQNRVLSRKTHLEKLLEDMGKEESMNE